MRFRVPKLVAPNMPWTCVAAAAAIKPAGTTAVWAAAVDQFCLYVLCCCCAGSIGWLEGNNSCSGDDLACWPRAQVNLLHTVANASGCTVLLVGDFHYSDLKVIQPGDDHKYADALQTAKLSKPVYQVWSAAAHASGLLLHTGHSQLLPPVHQQQHCMFTVPAVTESSNALTFLAPLPCRRWPVV